MIHAPTRPIQTLDRFFAPSKPEKTGLIEKIAVVASTTVIVLLIVVDVVRTAPAEATLTEITFDAAPDTVWAQPAPATDDRRAVEQTTKVSRPAAVR